MKVRFHPAATADLARQIDYYESRSPGSGARFNVAVKDIVSRVAAFPAHFPVISRPAYRRGIVRGFPFVVFFLQRPDHIEVLAISAQRERPDKWMLRR